MQKRENMWPFTAIVGIAAVVLGMASPEARGEQPPDHSGPIRATILLGEEPAGEIPEGETGDADSCRDVRERVTLALTARMEGAASRAGEAAYGRIAAKARPSIPVDDGVLAFLAEGMDAGTLCEEGCDTVGDSAQCLRSYLQALEDCAKQGNILACEVHYTCSVACAPAPERESAPETPATPWWYQPPLGLFGRSTPLPGSEIGQPMVEGGGDAEEKQEPKAGGQETVKEQEEEEQEQEDEEIRHAEGDNTLPAERESSVSEGEGAVVPEVPPSEGKEVPVPETNNVHEEVEAVDEEKQQVPDAPKVRQGSENEREEKMVESGEDDGRKRLEDARSADWKLRWYEFWKKRGTEEKRTNILRPPSKQKSSPFNSGKEQAPWQEHMPMGFSPEEKKLWEQCSRSCSTLPQLQEHERSAQGQLWSKEQGGQWSMDDRLPMESGWEKFGYEEMQRWEAERMRTHFPEGGAVGLREPMGLWERCMAACWEQSGGKPSFSEAFPVKP